MLSEHKGDRNRRFPERPDGKTTISFYCASASTVLQEMLEWGGEIGKTYMVYAPLAQEWYDFLGQYVTPNTTGILVPTYGEWCAFIDNSRNAGMPFGKLDVVSERLKIRSASFTLDNLCKCDDENDAYNSMFYYCDATRSETVTRSVSLQWYGGHWEFDETGAPLPFEEVEAYTRKRMADRLTHDMLIRYGQALGIRLDEGDALYKLDEAIGLKWEHKKTSGEESTNVILELARKINEEMGNIWKIHFFRRK